MTVVRIASQPVFFAHQGRAAVATGDGYGCQCAICGRDIAAPHNFQGRVIWCLYCGIARGLVPMVEHPWGHRWWFGVTADECIEDRAAIAAGNFEQVAEARARRNGQVIDVV